MGGGVVAEHVLEGATAEAVGLGEGQVVEPVVTQRLQSISHSKDAFVEAVPL